MSPIPCFLTSSSSAGVWHEASLLSWGVFSCSSSSHSCRFWFSCSCTLYAITRCHINNSSSIISLTRKDGVATSKLSEDLSKPMQADPSRKYSGHTVPNPQAHAVSHSVAQGDQRQFSDWPSNASFSLLQSRFSSDPELNLQWALCSFFPPTPKQDHPDSWASKSQVDSLNSSLPLVLWCTRPNPVIYIQRGRPFLWTHINRHA